MMQRIPAVIYTATHVIAGTVTVKERLAEVLVDRLTDYLDLMDASTSSLSQPDRGETHWPRVTVPKNRIAIATLDMPTHENAQARINKGAVKAGTKVCAIVNGMEVYGTAHLNSSGDLASRILTHQLRAFFPITDASLVLNQRPFGNTLSTQLALVNRDEVSVFSLL